MVKRLISFDELDKLEGLVEHYRQLQERLEILKADAAEFDTSAQGMLEGCVKLIRPLAKVVS